MPITYAKTWVADEDLLAADLNGNFTVIKNKFSETPGAGILDADCATDMGLSGLKLSTASGKRILDDKMEDDSVTARVLRDGLDAADAQRAVTDDHIRNATITKKKLTVTPTFRLTKAQTEIAVVSSIATNITDAAGVNPRSLGIVNTAGIWHVRLHFQRNSGVWSSQDFTTGLTAASNTILGLYFNGAFSLPGSSPFTSFTDVVYIPNT